MTEKQPPDFGQQTIGYELSKWERWLGVAIWTAAFAAFFLMCVTGTAPWQ